MKCLRTDKTESDASDESDLGVHRFDESVGQAVFDCGMDLFAVGADTVRKRDEGFDSAASCPLDPSFECFDILVGWELEDRP